MKHKLPEERRNGVLAELGSVWCLLFSSLARTYAEQYLNFKLSICKGKKSTQTN